MQHVLDVFHQKVDAPEKRNQGGRRIVRYLLQAAATIALAVLLSLSYQVFVNKNKRAVQMARPYSEVIVPNGHKAQLTLTDGTKIWLNSNSTLRYPVLFDGDSRKVYLEGEAYLDVAKDKDRSFFVETKNLTLCVLGTSFNIKSYEDEGQVEATLIEGSLRIVPSKALKKKFKSVTLKPNEKAIYKKEESVLSVKELDVVHPEEKQRHKKRMPEMKGLEISQIESIISWKDNELIFWNETFEDIRIKMERWYGISILIEDEKLKNYRYSGKFIYNETINQVMDILALTTPIGYKLDKNVLTIYEKE